MQKSRKQEGVSKNWQHWSDAARKRRTLTAKVCRASQMTPARDKIPIASTKLCRPPISNCYKLCGTARFPSTIIGKMRLFVLPPLSEDHQSDACVHGLLRHGVATL